MIMKDTFCKYNKKFFNLEATLLCQMIVIFHKQYVNFVPQMAALY